MGVEPTVHGFADRCQQPVGVTADYVPPPGFEPGLWVPKTRVLPLHQGGMCANASDTYARLRSAMPIQPVLLTGFQALSRGLSLQIGWRMVRESNSPGTSAPTVLAGLRLCRTAHHPCQCFQYGHTGQTSINPLMGTIFMRGSRSREDSNLRGLAPLLLSGQSHSTALPLLH